MELSPFRTFALLPKDSPIALPNTCVRCIGPKPEGRVTIWTSSGSWWGWIFPIVFLFPKTARVTFPACRGCAWRIRFRRLLATALMIALIVSAIHLSFHWFDRWPKLLRRLAVGGIALVALVPWALWQAFFPPPVELTIEGDNVRYEFREIEFAAEFRMMNRDLLLE